MGIFKKRHNNSIYLYLFGEAAKVASKVIKAPPCKCSWVIEAPTLQPQARLERRYRERVQKPEAIDQHIATWSVLAGLCQLRVMITRTLAPVVPTTIPTLPRPLGRSKTPRTSSAT